jgi:hypothetical protein
MLQNALYHLTIIYLRQLELFLYAAHISALFSLFIALNSTSRLSVVANWGQANWQNCNWISLNEVSLSVDFII